jgi:hypothetical protein
VSRPAGVVAVQAGGAPPGPGALPDINAETYPFATVQRLLDEAAYYSLYSLPDEGTRPLAMPATAGGGTIGFEQSERLHSFEIDLSPPRPGRGLLAANRIGGRLGAFTSRWMLMPDDFVALPGRQPPPTVLDDGRPQRFVMLDALCRLGSDGDGFEGFGTGMTFPSIHAGDRRLLAAAVGTLTAGFGRFRGLSGTYTYCGMLDPRRGFRGALLCRVMDPQGVLRSAAAPSARPEQQGDSPQEGATYLLFRGQKRDAQQHTSYLFGPGGEVQGLLVEQLLHRIRLETRSGGPPLAEARVGEAIGRMTARIRFNLFSPDAAGTDLSPIPFQSYNHYTFLDREGRSVGAFAADGGEGRTFQLALPAAPGQRALRFGGFGPVVSGDGPFEDLQGLMVDNSVVGVAPHALATLYIVRVEDPDGRFRV